MTQPFWWHPPWYLHPDQCAPAGWYRWTETGLVYLSVTLEKGTIGKTLQPCLTNTATFS